LWLGQFQEKARKRNVVEPASVSEPATEQPISQDRHFTANEVAALWHMHPSTIRRIFGSVIGVIKYGVGKYRTLYIPARLLEETHQNLAA
jgi:hypothetical protein